VIGGFRGSSAATDRLPLGAQAAAREEGAAVTQVTIELVWLMDGEVLVPATALSGMLRDVAIEVAAWPEQGADPATVDALEELLGRLADRIDTDCIALASDLDDIDDLDIDGNGIDGGDIAGPEGPDGPGGDPRDGP
jgi:hypothetical protein